MTHSAYRPQQCYTALFAAAMLLGPNAFAQHTGHTSAPRAMTAKNWTTLPTVVIQAGRSPEQPINASTTGSNFSALTLQTPASPAPKLMAPSAPGKWQIQRSDAGAGGHLWVVATDEGAQRTVRASSHLFLPMKPQVPTEMLKHSSGGLQFIPLRLPEFGGAREGSKWQFLVRFEEQPLPGAEVRLETAGGTQQTFRTDESGIVAVAFPRDFRDENINPESPMASRQNFVLAATHVHAGREHLTAYNHYYLPDRMRERSLLGGIGALVAGMALATPLLRRKEKKNA